MKAPAGVIVTYTAGQELPPCKSGTAPISYNLRMARSSILNKLEKALSKELTGEDQVVYILVEVRKLIDMEPDQSRFMSLKLYCDWAVHTELTYPSRTRPILTLVDQDIFNCFHPDGHGTSPEDNEKLQRLLYWDGFRSDLLDFLRASGLPASIAEDDKKWFNFLAQYAHVIEDCSLVYKSDDLRMVTEMTFRKEGESGGALPFNVVWDLKLKDGRTLSWNLHPNWKLVGSIMTERPAPRERGSD
jgi:hypothetical protein